MMDENRLREWHKELFDVFLKTPDYDDCKTEEEKAQYIRLSATMHCINKIMVS